MHFLYGCGIFQSRNITLQAVKVYTKGIRYINNKSLLLTTMRIRQGTKSEEAEDKELEEQEELEREEIRDKVTEILK